MIPKTAKKRPLVKKVLLLRFFCDRIQVTKEVWYNEV